MEQATYFCTLPSGELARLYTLRNATGGTVRISDWGGTLISLEVPDRAGHMTDVLLGWKNPQDYITNPGYLGALVGRVANRIAGGRFVMDGVIYQMMINDGGGSTSTLQGGFGCSHRLWTVENYDSGRLVLGLESPDGDAGFPGRMQIKVIYSWNDKAELSIEYRAETDAPTPVNLTNHAYFNLNGESSNDISGLAIRIAANEYNPVDGELIPTGVAPVGGEIPDLRRPVPFPAIIESVPDGLDHNYILGRDFSWKQDCAEVWSQHTGIHLSVSTDRSGIQFYMGGGLGSNPPGKSVEYRRFAGFCLETQEWPDSLNHPDFPSMRLNPGEEYVARTIYRFTAEK